MSEMTTAEWMLACVRLSGWRINDCSDNYCHLINGESTIFVSIIEEARIVGSITVAPDHPPLSFRGRREFRVALDYDRGWLFDELRARLVVAGALSPKEDWLPYEQHQLEMRGLEAVIEDRIRKIKLFQRFLTDIS